VAGGDINPNDAASISAQWDGFATDAFDGQEPTQLLVAQLLAAIARSRGTAQM